MKLPMRFEWAGLVMTSSFTGLEGRLQLSSVELDRPAERRSEDATDDVERILALCERRSFVPTARHLILVCGSKNGTLVPRPADNLQSEREPAFVKTTANADRRQSIMVGEHCVLRRQRQGIPHRFLDWRNDGWRCRQQQQVDVAKASVGDGPSVSFYVGYAFAEIRQGSRCCPDGVAKASDRLDRLFERFQHFSIRSGVVCDADPEVRFLVQTVDKRT